MLLGIWALLGLGGCKESEPAPPQEPIEGGAVTYRTDPDAPKEIQSREIAEFDAVFRLYTRWKAQEEDNSFHFRVAPDGGGTLTASEEVLGLRRPADEALLRELQEIIEENGLAEQNGLYDVTAGLDPGHQEGGLKVLYASGETLQFTKNNDPYAAWAEEVYDAFAAWFSGAGDDSLYPPGETSPVSSLTLRVLEGNEYREYRTRDGAGEGAGQTRVLERSLPGLPGERAPESVPLPEDYGTRVCAILEEYHLARHYRFSIFNRASGLLDRHDQGYYGLGDPPEGERDAEDRKVTLHLLYENGRRINIDTRKPSEMEALQPLLTALTDYHDALFS